MSHTMTRPWVQCSKKNPCPACGADHYCTLSTDGILSKCMRTAGGKTIPQKDGTTAYLRRVAECTGSPGKPIKSHKPQAKRLTTKELELMIRQTRTGISARRLAAAAKELNVSERALLSLGVGWFSDYDCISFPMYNGSRKPVGIRLRLPATRQNGRKYICVPGSENGLFIPDGYDPRPIPDSICDDAAPLVILTPEGPTDVAAAIDLGFQAIGRPSNAGGQMHLCTLLSNAPCKVELAIFADHDETKFAKDGMPFLPGWEGALSVAQYLDGHANVSRMKVIMPPKDCGKDLRDWMRDGGTAELMIAVLAGCEAVTTAWLKRKRRAMDLVKAETVRLFSTNAAADPKAALEMAKARIFSAG